MTERDDDIAEALAEVSRLNTEAEELAARAGTGTALVPAAVGADEAKAVMVGLRHQVAVKLGELKAADKRLKDLIDAKRRALEDQRARMTAALAPLKEQMELLEAGIGAVNLYLGVGEHLVTLVDGPPAPAGTPIMVLQGVLAMDEESAIDPEGGGIDHLRIGDFDAWITARPGRIEQLIPFERGVVAIMPRRATKDYGDAWANQAHNDANHATYFLIRNGRALYRYIAEGFRAAGGSPRPGTSSPPCSPSPGGTPRRGRTRRSGWSPATASGSGPRSGPAQSSGTTCRSRSSCKG